MTYKVLATTGNMKYSKDGQDLLKKNDCQVNIVDLDPYSKEEGQRKILEMDEVYDAVIAGGETWDRRTFQKIASKLKILVRFGAGFEAVDIKVATDYNIPVANTPGANASAVSEHAIMLMLCLARDLPRLHQQTMGGRWERGKIGIELKTKTIGIIGLGNIGKETVKKLSGFGVEFLAFDVFRDDGFAKKYGVKFVELDELFEMSDFISIHCLYNEHTRRLIDADKLAKMKSTAYIINTSRGGIIDEQALIKALQNKEIAGAGLDTFKNEPLNKDSLLLGLDNVVITPHIAAATYKANNSIGLEAAKCVIKVLKNGEKPLNLLNPEVYTKQKLSNA